MTEMNHGRAGRSGAFGDTVAADLASGRAVDLAELYALDAVTDEERRAIEEYLATAPAAERASFFERVRESRETLTRTFRVEEEPPAGLFDRIAAQLPAQLPSQANGPEPAAADPSASSLPAQKDPFLDGSGDELARAGSAGRNGGVRPEPAAGSRVSRPQQRSPWAVSASDPTLPTRMIR
jgi:hypothetical protein